MKFDTYVVYDIDNMPTIRNIHRNRFFVMNSKVNETRIIFVLHLENLCIEENNKNLN